MGDDNEADLIFSISEELTVLVMINIWCLQKLGQLSTDTRATKNFLGWATKYNL
jgi:hypothetical protein